MSPYLSMLGLAVRRPRAIPHLLRAAWAFRDRRWLGRFPFLPLPPVSYLKWRFETAYGDPDHRPTDDEIVRYLSWATSMRREMRGRAGA